MADARAEAAVDGSIEDLVARTSSSADSSLIAACQSRPDDSRRDDFDRVASVVAVRTRLGNGARVKLLPRPTGRRSSEVKVGELTLIVESQVPSTGAEGRRSARPWVTELVGGPGAGWRGDLSEAGVAPLPASLLATRRRDGSVDPIGEYVLERLDGGVAYYGWHPSPT